MIHKKLRFPIIIALTLLSNGLITAGIRENVSGAISTSCKWVRRNICGIVVVSNVAIISALALKLLSVKTQQDSIVQRVRLIHDQLIQNTDRLNGNTEAIMQFARQNDIQLKKMITISELEAQNLTQLIQGNKALGQHINYLDRNITLLDRQIGSHFGAIRQPEQEAHAAAAAEQPIVTPSAPAFVRRHLTPEEIDAFMKYGIRPQRTTNITTSSTATTTK